MTEIEIIKKVEAWHNQDKIQAIVDFIEALPLEQKTPKVLSELARAYNNLYWLESTEENEKWLRKAVDLLLYLETDMDEENVESWNYRIAWSYFYLGENEKAQTHFQKYMELSENPHSMVPIYLECAKLGIKENRSCAKIFNSDNIKTQDQIKFLRQALEDKAPKILARLGNPATEEDIRQVEQKLGIVFPEEFKAMHLDFSGQKDQEPFFHRDNERLVSIHQISAVQEQIVQYLAQHFGENWQEIKMPETSDEENNGTFEDGEVIKNTLYNPKWIPLLACENYYICADLDPVNEENVGQVILVSMGESVEDYRVSWLFHSVGDWLGYIKNQLKSEELTYDEETNTLRFPEREYKPLIYSEEEKTALHQYIAEKFGEVKKIIPDPDYDENRYDINCEVCIIEPDENRDYYTLMTSGTGAYIMDCPNGVPYSIELIINLPKTWNPDENIAPIDWLRTIARFPIKYNTWLGDGHSIPLELSGTDFKGMVLVIMNDYNEEKDEYIPYCADITEEHKVAFMCLTPVYKEEMDYKLDHSSEALFDKFIEYNVPYPPVLDIHRQNTCEGYEVSENPYHLDNIAWSFGEIFEPNLSNFWSRVFDYNQQIDIDLDNYKPYATIFNGKKVKVIYEAWIKDKEQLHNFEQLIDPSQLDGEPDEDGLYQVEIIAECEANDDTMLAMELLQWINNSLYNKELGDHIFFEGISLQGREEDGTPVVYLELGS